MSEVIQIALILAGSYVILQIFYMIFGPKGQQEKEQMAAQRQIDVLQERVDDLSDQLHQLSLEVARLQGQERGKSMQGEDMLLLICGDDVLCRSDRAALRRAGIDFYRLAQATKHSIERELQRSRNDRRPYKYIHVTAHASANTISLADGPVDGEWWNEILTQDTQILFLASCSSDEIADQLAGLIDTVITVREDVENEHASDFTYSFWHYVVQGKRAGEAFLLARKEVPSVAEYALLRSGDNR